MEILKKITIAKMGLGKDQLLRACIDLDGKAAPIARIFGRCFGSEHKMGDNGPYTLFRGMFESVNLLTGETYKSGLLILNGAAEGMLDGLLSVAEASRESENDTAEVPFIYEIGVKYVKDSSGAPYQFTVTPIGEEKLQLVDPLAEVRAAALGGVAQVPASLTKDAGKKGAKETAKA